jgi:phospholipid transport system substrate-binding protein
MKIIQQGVIIIIGLLASLPAWANNDGPRVVIENTVKHIIQALDARQDKSRLTDHDRDAIRKAVEGHFDYRTMARRSLGKPWKKLARQDRTEFTDVFRELLERSYGNRLSEYKGQTVAFSDAKLKKKRALVKSEVIDGSRKTPVHYSMHQTDDGWQVYDIRIEGASMIRTFREDFKSVLKQGGYEHLLKTLKEKIAKLKAKEAS